MRSTRVPLPTCGQVQSTILNEIYALSALSWFRSQVRQGTSHAESSRMLLPVVSRGSHWCVQPNGLVLPPPSQHQPRTMHLYKGKETSFWALAEGKQERGGAPAYGKANWRCWY
jgi:hypothetical protein